MSKHNTLLLLLSSAFSHVFLLIGYTSMRTGICTRDMMTNQAALLSMDFPTAIVDDQSGRWGLACRGASCVPLLPDEHVLCSARWITLLRYFEPSFLSLCLMWPRAGERRRDGGCRMSWETWGFSPSLREQGPRPKFMSGPRDCWRGRRVNDISSLPERCMR